MRASPLAFTCVNLMSATQSAYECLPFGQMLPGTSDDLPNAATQARTVWQ
jgi:hypothetical protein